MVSCVRAVYLVLVLALATVASLEEPQQSVDVDSPSDTVSNNRIERDIAIAADSDGKSGEGRILGSVATTTLWSISVSTSTRYISCNSGTKASTVCGGRKKKKRSTNIRHIDDNIVPDISGSLDSNKEKEEKLELEKPGKLYGFTVWSAVTASTTVTVLTTNTDTTVRLSYYCTAALAEYAPNSCG